MASTLAHRRRALSKVNLLHSLLFSTSCLPLLGAGPSLLQIQEIGMMVKDLLVFWFSGLPRIGLFF
jgi:hypothetical protein